MKKILKKFIAFLVLVFICAPVCVCVSLLAFIIFQPIFLIFLLTGYIDKAEIVKEYIDATYGFCGYISSLPLMVINGKTWI